jgi:hypothetical protein
MRMLQAIAGVDDRRLSGRQMRVAAARLGEIELTRAPDDGQLAFEVDQHPVGPQFDGYAPGVPGPITVTVGTFAMRAGRWPASLIITGRNTASTGFLVGVNRILMKPAGT